MYLRKHDGGGPPARPDRAPDETPTFVPSIDTRDVFRTLIAEELRNGRLTPTRRRRIIRYAAALKMSAVEAGRLIAACREEALRSNDLTERYHALRLAEPRPARTPIALRIAIVVTLVLIVDLLIVGWPW